MGWGGETEAISFSAVKCLKMERCIAIDTISGSGLSAMPASSCAAIRCGFQPGSCASQVPIMNICSSRLPPAEILKPSLVTVISLGSVSNYTFLAAFSRSGLLA